MRLTVWFFGTSLFYLPEGPERPRVLIPECGDTSDYPGPPAKAAAHHTFLLIPAADLTGARWMDECKVKGTSYRAARLGLHPHKRGARGLGPQRMTLMAKGTPSGTDLRNRIAKVADANGEALRLNLDPARLALDFRLPEGSIEWQEANGTGEEEGEWTLNSGGSTLPWIVRWSSAPDLSGFQLRFDGLADGRTRGLRFVSSHDVNMYVFNVEARRPKDAASVPRRTKVHATTDEVVDYDFAWLYRLVECVNSSCVLKPVLPTWRRSGRAPLSGASLPTCFPGGF